jgi:hypothetical protein
VGGTGRAKGGGVSAGRAFSPWPCVLVASRCLAAKRRRHRAAGIRWACRQGRVYYRPTRFAA